MTSYKILIVDDIIENLQTTIRILEDLHPEYRLYQAIRGRSAIELAEANAIDLIIADWDMPELSGIDMIRILKSNPKTDHIPIVIVTGVMLTAKDLKLALSEGAYDYLRKPVDPVELSARVHSALLFASCHAREIGQKNLELAEKTLVLIKNNEFNIELTDRVKKLLNFVDGKYEAEETIQHIIKEINQKINEDSWQQFEIAFQNVHADFIRNLRAQYPDLTPAEMKLAILIKLGLDNKQIASILYQSSDSIKVARSRLRKKMNLSNDISFSTYLAAF